MNKYVIISSNELHNMVINHCLSAWHGLQIVHVVIFFAYTAYYETKATTGYFTIRLLYLNIILMWISPDLKLGVPQAQSDADSVWQELLSTKIS